MTQLLYMVIYSHCFLDGGFQSVWKTLYTPVYA